MDEKKFAEEVIDKLKELILVKKNGETIVNFPVNVGIVVGVAAAPWALILAAITTLGMNCHIEVLKDDGEIVTII